METIDRFLSFGQYVLARLILVEPPAIERFQQIRVSNGTALVQYLQSTILCVFTAPLRRHWRRSGGTFELKRLRT